MNIEKTTRIPKPRAVVQLMREEKLFWKNTRERRIPYNRRDSVIPKHVLLGLESMSGEERLRARTGKHNRRSSTISNDILLTMIRDFNMSSEKSNTTKSTTKAKTLKPNQDVDFKVPRRRRRRASSTISAAWILWWCECDNSSIFPFLFFVQWIKLFFFC